MGQHCKDLMQFFKVFKYDLLVKNTSRRIILYTLEFITKQQAQLAKLYFIMLWYK